MQTISSRRFLRRLRVRFRPLGDPEPKTGYTTNISQTGMFIATIRPLKPVRVHEPAEKAEDLRELMNVPSSLH